MRCLPGEEEVVFFFKGGRQTPFDLRPVSSGAGGCPDVRRAARPAAGRGRPPRVRSASCLAPRSPGLQSAQRGNLSAFTEPHAPLPPRRTHVQYLCTVHVQYAVSESPHKLGGTRSLPRSVCACEFWWDRVIFTRCSEEVQINGWFLQSGGGEFVPCVWGGMGVGHPLPSQVPF